MLRSAADLLPCSWSVVIGGVDDEVALDDLATAALGDGGDTALPTREVSASAKGYGVLSAALKWLSSR